MFSHYKTSTAALMRVRLFDTAFAPVTGVAQGSMTVTLMDSAGGTTALTPVTHFTWSEVTAGAFSGQGLYLLTLNSSLFGTAGEFTVACSGGTGKSVSEFAVYSALPADAKTSADAAAADAALARKMATNKSIVNGSNQFLVYDDNGTSILKTFNTKDVDGIASHTSIFQRIPV